MCNWSGNNTPILLLSRCGGHFEEAQACMMTDAAVNIAHPSALTTSTASNPQAEQMTTLKAKPQMPCLLHFLALAAQ
jgi:hypothetical protein